jgi:dihydrolipoamide dehydrogenase
MSDKFDVVVVGGGPGGYVAAIRAAQLGAKVALIEKNKVGGVCLNRGCIPTKALLTCVSLFENFQKADSFGITAKEVSIDLGKVVARKNKIVARLVKGVEFLLEKNGVEIIYGEGIVKEPHLIKVGNREVHSRATILATGSSPACLPGVSFDGEKFLSSDDILNCTTVPKNLDVVGGGVIGLHFAYLFSALGSEVTIYEALPEILPGIDEEVVALVKKILARKKIKIQTGVRFNAAQSCGKTLLCVGRIPADKNIKVNQKMETALPGVYAIGDLISPKMFAHIASEQGIVAAENALGGNRSFDYNYVPYTIYTHPEIAGIGLTEKKARENHPAVRIGKFPFAALGMAAAVGEVEGFAKIVADEKDKILGVHIIGPDANTLIGSAALALRNGLTVEQLALTTQAHPSYPEGLQEAALSALKRSLHTINQ